MSNWELKLANAIIMQAIDDISKLWPDKKDFKGADIFLKSDWFKSLADHVEIHPDKILAKVRIIKTERARKWYAGLLVSGIDAQLLNMPDKTDDASIVSAWMASSDPKQKNKTESVHSCARSEIK